MIGSLSTKKLSRNERLSRTADWLAAGALLTLPWSTSATSILILGWLLVVIPTLNREDVFDQLREPAALTSIVLLALVCLGLFWTEASWPERIEGLRTFLKLLIIPFLLLHFRRSANGHKVVLAFLLSSFILLMYSWASLRWTSLVWPGGTRVPGVPIKDYIFQNMFFVISACALMHLALTFLERRQKLYTLLCLLFVAVLLANIAYVGTSRTAVVVLVILSFLIGYQRFGWRGAVALTAIVLLFGAVAWSTSSYFQERIVGLVQGTLQYERTGETSEAERLEYWRKSLVAMREAPVVGHGTGSIRDVFEKLQEGTKGAAGRVMGNPHNQVFAVGIQLGIVGIAALLLMWASHLLLFRGTGLVAWLGTLVVVQNIASSMFNSHISDFTSGWAYVLAVGILGGTALRQRADNPPRVEQTGRPLAD
jgi:O-antigen ligase